MKGDLLLCTWNSPSINKILNWFITFFIKNKYVHIAVAADDYDAIIEATPSGVHQTKNYWVNYDVYRIDDIMEYQIDTALNFARKQIGDWYDWKALIYLMWLYVTFQRNKINEWNDKNKWFCSELVASMFRKSGKTLCPNIPDSNTTPADIANSKIVHKEEN